VGPLRVATLEDAETAINSLRLNVDQLAGRIRHLEKMLDTRATPFYRRVVFRLDGWPSWPYVALRPAWRPWRRWWRS
jgi:hypothetical protein